MLNRRGAGFLGSGSLLLGGSLVLAAAKAAILWFLANRYGPEVQGGFSLLLAASTLGAIVFGLGLEYANAFVAGRTPEATGGVVANSLALTGLSLPVVLVGGWLLALIFPQSVLGLTAWGGIVVLAGATSLTGLLQMLQAVGIGAKRFGLVASANALWGLAALVGVVALAAYGYPGVVGAWILCMLGVVVCYLAGFRTSRASWLRPRAALLGRQLRYGIRTWPGSLARALNMRVPLYACALFLGEREVGVYGVAVAAADAFLYLPTALGRVTLGLTAAGEARPSQRRTSYVLMAGAGLAAALVSWIVGEPLLVLVFGEPYARAALPLTVLFLAVTIHAVGLVRLHYLLGAGQPHVASLAQAVALLFVLLGAWLLVPRLGLLGAALTTLVTYSAFSIYLFTRTATDFETVARAAAGD